MLRPPFSMETDFPVVYVGKVSTFKRLANSIRCSCVGPTHWPPTSTTLPSPRSQLSVRPPTRSSASRTTTDRPASVRASAAVSPARPAPTIATSTEIGFTLSTALHSANREKNRHPWKDLGSAPWCRSAALSTSAHTGCMCVDPVLVSALCTGLQSRHPSSHRGAYLSIQLGNWTGCLLIPESPSVPQWVTPPIGAGNRRFAVITEVGGHVALRRVERRPCSRRPGRLRRGGGDVCQVRRPRDQLGDRAPH